MESTELQLYALPKTAGELEAAFISGDYTDRLIEEIRAKAKSVVGDINTTKGRKAYISMAATVRSSKVAIDDAGKTLVAEMKKRPALVDASRRKIREALDELAIEIRQPVTDWEAEQERIKVEEALAAAHAEALEMNEAFDKAVAEKFESDHEIALLMNDKFDRDRAETARLAEQQRIEHEQRIAQEAEERVKREVEEKAQRDREETELRERELQAAAEKEKQERIAAEQRAEQQRTEAQQLAERDKREAIEAERRKAAQVEQARLAEEKRIKDEADRRARDTEHRRNINLAAVSALVESGLTEDCAKACIKSIAKGQVPAVTINY
ncbi:MULTISPECIES: hypothetical protein [unclassified Tatumella]|uniref:hypothetical protein n=1 Tax=unclassified Tatumella TaxID=2649542 RepID=UPI001BB02688|nr:MULTISPECIES: hypothetical protein [unclassified Tatumella]MBS0857270.1 hypothetical protein [Tatumella sp. JGM16]MBS0914023.1 hypothetical protein [Tatumella sp. JGM91]